MYCFLLIVCVCVHDFVSDYCVNVSLILLFLFLKEEIYYNCVNYDNNDNDTCSSRRGFIIQYMHTHSH